MPSWPTTQVPILANPDHPPVERAGGRHRDSGTLTRPGQALIDQAGRVALPGGRLRDETPSRPMPALHQDLRAPMSGIEHSRAIDGDGRQEHEPHRADRNALCGTPDRPYLRASVDGRGESRSRAERRHCTRCSRRGLVTQRDQDRSTSGSRSPIRRGWDWRLAGRSPAHRTSGFGGFQDQTGLDGMYDGGHGADQPPESLDRPGFAGDVDAGV